MLERFYNRFIIILFFACSAAFLSGLVLFLFLPIYSLPKELALLLFFWIMGSGILLLPLSILLAVPGLAVGVKTWFLKGKDERREMMDKENRLLTPLWRKRRLFRVGAVLAFLGFVLMLVHIFMEKIGREEPHLIGIGGITFLIGIILMWLVMEFRSVKYKKE